MIVVSYEEKIVNVATGAVTTAHLGSETHDAIEEVLLPSNPSPGTPIFFTKKFAGRHEYRWQVNDVRCMQGATALTYVVVLQRRPQIDKQDYLKNILTARKEKVRRVLHPWAIVEVEFGHALTVGKVSGDVRGNKRYVDTVQQYSMPKRRLAVVLQVLERASEDLVQVIPITSKPPLSTDKTAVEVTSELSTMVHYQKPSWAVSQMTQTVTASRIIAPKITPRFGPERRDKGFNQMVRGTVRDALKDAIMHGVAAGGRVSDSAALVEERSKAAQLAHQVSELADKVALYEQLVEYNGLTLDEVREMFKNPLPMGS